MGSNLALKGYEYKMLSKERIIEMILHTVVNKNGYSHCAGDGGKMLQSWGCLLEL